MTLSHDFSYVSASDNTFIDSLYSDFKKNPDSVDPSWRQFFKGVEFALTRPADETSDSTKVGNLGKEFKVYGF